MAHTRTIAVVSFVAASLLLAAHGTRAEDFSGKPIKFLVGASPGGTTDTMARAIASPLSASLGRPVIVENRPGAGGNLAADAVAKSPPDGSTPAPPRLECYERDRILGGTAVAFYDLPVPAPPLR